VFKFYGCAYFDKPATPYPKRACSKIHRVETPPKFEFPITIKLIIKPFKPTLSGYVLKFRYLIFV
jgi:hypothetical protein